MSPAPRWHRVVILGGTGFCGSHFAEFLLTHHLAGHVELVDLAPPQRGRYSAAFDSWLCSDRLRYVPGDVRAPLVLAPGAIDLVANFAAVHREPGHRDHEYFETNVLGAFHACALAADHDCRELIFASSIAPYGAGDEPKDETSVPSPTTAYGASKLEAERIHQAWAGERADRRLTIVRPGVVFGPGEGGNVSRLVRAVANRRFAYVGSKDVRKAGLYVGDFVRATLWAHERSARGAPLLANLTMHPAPSVEEFVQSVARELEMDPWIPTVPLTVAKLGARIVHAVARLVGRESEWHPVRVEKLTRSNHIVPQVLLAGGYQPAYTLASAMREWRALKPSEWR